MALPPSRFRQFPTGPFQRRVRRTGAWQRQQSRLPKPREVQQRRTQQAFEQLTGGISSLGGGLLPSGYDPGAALARIQQGIAQVSSLGAQAGSQQGGVDEGKLTVTPRRSGCPEPPDAPPDWLAKGIAEPVMERRNGNMCIVGWKRRNGVNGTSDVQPVTPTKGAEAQEPGDGRTPPGAQPTEPGEGIPALSCDAMLLTALALGLIFLFRFRR